ncbi:MAG TPA: hypothetical protein VEX64_10355 [Pyrinomonadaceae bacterium]|nr:hypothetical protein [Pyrinomonadaceae bacterium]
MASNIQATGGKMSRRTMTLLISAAVAALIIGLLYYERIDALYILATLGLVALLIIVAKADLIGEGRKTENEEVKL